MINLFFDDTYAGERVVFPTATASVMVYLPEGFNGFNFIAECQVGGDLSVTFDLADQVKDLGMTMVPVVLKHGDSAHFFRSETTWQCKITRANTISPEQGFQGSGNGSADGGAATIDAWTELFTPNTSYIAADAYSSSFTVLKNGVFAIEVQTEFSEFGAITATPFSFGTQLTVSNLEILGHSKTYHSRNNSVSYGTDTCVDTYIVRGVATGVFTVSPWLNNTNSSADSYTSNTVLRIRKIADYEAPLTVVNMLSVNDFSAINQGAGLLSTGTWYKLTGSTSELLSTGTNLVCDASAATSTEVDDFSYYTSNQTVTSNADYRVDMGVTLANFATYHDLDLAIYLRMYPGDSIEGSRVLKFKLHLGADATTSFGILQAKDGNSTTFVHTSSEFHQWINTADGHHEFSVLIVNGLLSALWDSIPIVDSLDLSDELQSDVTSGIFWRPGVVGIAMLDKGGATPTSVTTGAQLDSINVNTIVA
jgi:hypothetical protein